MTALRRGVRLTVLDEEVGGTPFVGFNGTSTKVNLGSEASLDNLPGADGESAYTIEWWQKGNPGKTILLFSKGNWYISNYENGGRYVKRVYLNCATTDIISNDTASEACEIPDEWAHHAVVYNPGGNRKIQMFTRGIAGALSGASAGNYEGDASDDLTLGDNTVWPWTYIPDNVQIGWVRISDNVRYTTNFTPPGRDAPPENDANTVRLFKCDEGAGTTLTDYSSNAQDATVTDPVWGSE